MHDLEIQNLFSSHNGKLKEKYRWLNILVGG